MKIKDLTVALIVYVFCKILNKRTLKSKRLAAELLLEGIKK
jgi:hypothetical protein